MTRPDAPTPRTRRGAYAKSERRRADILAAARHVFSTRGFRTGSLKEIAGEVGIDTSSIFHYYPNKDALLQAILEDYDSRPEEAVSAADLRPEEIPHAFLALARQNEHNPDVVRLYALLSVESADPQHPSHAYFRDRYARVKREFSDAFATMAAARMLAPGVDAQHAAESTLALWDGMQVQWMHDPAVDVTARLRHHLGRITTVDLEAAP
ncbi:TetR/AcrR family transcriptional regulator [Microbacterium sp. NPDC091313]